ncbi:hypothetical protein THS27_17590 [Thalassospira sp. MCCC 1A01428]|nr:hypothetical protein THS27_17590 [Thalassospira sp. MCCC 1A01428]
MPTAYQDYNLTNVIMFPQLNNEDGSSILFKITTEFGLIGLFFYFFMVFKAIKTHLYCNSSPWLPTFLVGIIFCTIRGTTYVDGITILAISAAIFINKREV